MLGEGKGKELEKVKEEESIPSELDRIMYYCNKPPLLQIRNNYLLRIMALNVKSENSRLL